MVDDSPLDRLLLGLRAVAEGTRLRILALCAHGELTVSDLVEILGQSQPRVSRHLKLLVEGGLLERQQEGNWAFYRLSERGAAAALARQIVDLIPDDDPEHALDLKRLEEVRAGWAVQAEAYFKRNAATWDRVRALHVDEAKVDAALRRLLGRESVGELLDIGTGTGRVLELLGDKVVAAIGIDRSLDMLKVARANVLRAGLRHCQVRHADMSRLPFQDGRFDAAVLHMALHYAEDPAAALCEAGRVLRPGGRLIVVDFDEHEQTALREQHAHRWLGFSATRMERLFEQAGLAAGPPERLPGQPLTVCLWTARRAANDTAVEASAAGAPAEASGAAVQPSRSGATR